MIGDSHKKSDMTVAIIHAPSESGSELESIWEHLIASVAHRGIRLNKVHFNPQSEILAELVSHRLSIQLILVWGLKSQPRWGDLFRQYCSQLRIDYLVAITQEDLSRFRLFPPQSKQGDILPLTVPSHREKRLAGFFAGFFYGATPYGYKKAPVMTSLPNWMKHKRGTGPQILELGDPYEIEIVQ
ncbi:MAG: hypothetical protein KC978_23220, partial [Candidatus Omnitrophica bacterium]|nr:hypothetical protein [Candidatus Omnitrophota bacterium]